MNAHIAHASVQSTMAHIPKLAVRKLSHRYGEGPAAVWALRDINIEVGDGEFLVLLGQSGCGKSTLLNILGGLIVPTAGEVEVAGTPLFPLASKAKAPRLSYVFQEANLLPWRTVLGNVTLPLELANVSREERDREGLEILKVVGLADFADKMPYQLSGGMRQRVSIARALVGTPDIVLMDEPFGALDAMTREQMNAFLQDLWIRRRFSVVFVTHSISEAIFLADRVVVLSSRPGGIRDIHQVGFDRPRHADQIADAEYRQLVNTLRQQLN